MSGLDTSVVGSSLNQVPSQASKGNLGFAGFSGSNPFSSLVSTLPDQTPLDPTRDDSLFQSGWQLASSKVGDLRNPIAPPVTSLEGAMVISSAGTSQSGGSKEKSDTLPERVSDTLTLRPRESDMSDLRQTPTERTSEKPTDSQILPQYVLRTEFDALKYEIEHLKAENHILRENSQQQEARLQEALQLQAAQFKKEIDALKALVQSSMIPQSTQDISMKDNTTEGEKEEQQKKVVDKGKGILLEEEQFQGEQTLGESVVLEEIHEPYIPEAVGAMEEELEEGEISTSELIDELAYTEDCLLRRRKQIEDLKDAEQYKRELQNNMMVRQRLENQRRIRRERLVDARTKIGPEWDAARMEMIKPEIVLGNKDEDVLRLLNAYRSEYQNVHFLHEALNQAITSVSVSTLKHGWMISASIQGLRSGTAHITSKLLRSLSLTEIFVFKNKVITTGAKSNEFLRDMMVRWLEDIGVEVHSNPKVIKYFKNQMMQNMTLEDEHLSRCSIGVLDYLEEQLRWRSSHHEEGRSAAEILYAYRLNNAILRNWDVNEVNRQGPYPTQPLDRDQESSDPENVLMTNQRDNPLVLSDPTRIRFKKKRNEDFRLYSLESLQMMPSKYIQRALKFIKVSTHKADKLVLGQLQEFLIQKEAEEKRNDTDRVKNHPARVIVKLEGMDLVKSFRKLSQMNHIPSLQKIKKSLSEPPPTNALEDQALNIVTAQIENLEAQGEQRRQEAMRKREDDLKEQRKQSKKI